MSRLSDLKLALTLQLADRISAPAKRVSGSVREMNDRLQRTRSELAAINQANRNVRSLGALDGRVGKTSEQLATAQRRLQELQTRAASGTGAPSRTLQRQMESAARRVHTLSDRHAQLNERTGALRQQLSAAGIDTSNLSRAKQQLDERSRRLNDTLGRQRQQMARLREMPDRLAAGWDRLRGAGARLGRALAWTAGIGAAGLAGGAALGAPMVGIAAESERLQAQLFAVEGSAERARSAMQWVHRFHESTPFELGKVTQAFVELRNEGLDPTQGLMKSLANAGAALGGDITGAADAVMGAMHGRTRALRNLGIAAERRDDLMEFRYIDREGNERVLSALADDRAMIASAVQRILDDKFTGTLEHFEQTWDGIWGNTTEHWTRFRRMIMDSGPFEVLKGRMAGVLDRLDAMVESGEMEALAERIGGELITLIDRIGDLGERAWAFMGDVRSHASTLAEFVGGWRNLAGILVGLKLVGVGTALAGIAGGIKLVSGAVLLLGKLALAHPLLALVTALAAGALWVAANWDQVKERLGAGWEWLSEKAASIGARLKQLFLDWTPLGRIIQHWDEIKDYFSGLPDRFADYGRNIIDGIRTGIDDRIDAVKQRILGLADMLPDWLRDRLDIRSPSRVMAEIGGHISDGVGVGIEQRAGRALAAVRRLGDRLPGALPTAMAVGLAASGGVQAAPTGVPHSMSAPAPVVIHATINVHPTPGMDAEAVGRAVRDELQQLQRQASARTRSRLYDED